MLVLSSPSGAGKTTISRLLLEQDKNLQLSISVTTRPKRPGETHGLDYSFVDTATFNRMAEKNELLEHAKVFGHYYGTPRGPVETCLSAGHDILFDIDWQGTQQLAERMRQDLVSIFILPPSWSELERRLQARAQDEAREIANRMSKAADEMSHWQEYDYVIINEDLEVSLYSVRSILHAERLKRSRQRGLYDFVKNLKEGN